MTHFVKKSYPNINKLNQDFMRFKMINPVAKINAVEINRTITGSKFILNFEWED